MHNPLSYNATLVLQALTEGYVYGFDIMRVTHLPSGTVYPLLRRLEAAGFLESSWEDTEAAHEAGRPARRYYRATSRGRTALARARERVFAQQMLFNGGARPAEQGGSGGD